MPSAMNGDGGANNGRSMAPDGDAAADDDLDAMPLDPAEEAAASAEAATASDESLDERIEAVLEELDGVERVRAGDVVTYRVGSTPFAVLASDVLEVRLEPVVARAALRTPRTTASPRGAGWVAFAPDAIDRFALDRAEAWFRSAHLRAAGR